MKMLFHLMELYTKLCTNKVTMIIEKLIPWCISNTKIKKPSGYFIIRKFLIENDEM